jgi:hypothetical protein
MHHHGGCHSYNIYCVSSNLSKTAAVFHVYSVIEQPHGPPMLGGSGQRIEQLLIHYGPEGWPDEKAQQLITATKSWFVLNEDYQMQMANLLMECFNTLFRPATESDKDIWENVTWYEPSVEAGSIIAYGYVHHNNTKQGVKLDIQFTNSDVIVSYMGPVSFRLDLLQPQTRHTFKSMTVFRTANGTWQDSVRQDTAGKFWPKDEANHLFTILIRLDYLFMNFADGHYQNNLPHFPLTPLEFREHVTEQLLAGLTRLLKKLRRVGSELHDHDADDEYWRDLKWHPLQMEFHNWVKIAATEQTPEEDYPVNVSARLVSENEQNCVTWNFKKQLAAGIPDNEVTSKDYSTTQIEITIRSPVRFVPREATVREVEDRQEEH